MSEAVPPPPDDSRGAGSDGRLRVSDAERDAVVDQLRGHTTAGRLTLAEFDERVLEALSARTREDLAWVLRELPAPEDPAAARRTARHERAQRARAWVGPVVGATVLVVALANFGWAVWWLVFPLFFWSGGSGLFGAGSCGSGRSADTDPASMTDMTDTETAGTVHPRGDRGRHAGHHGGAWNAMSHRGGWNFCDGWQPRDGWDSFAGWGEHGRARTVATSDRDGDDGAGA